MPPSQRREKWTTQQAPGDHSAPATSNSTFYFRFFRLTIFCLLSSFFIWLSVAYLACSIWECGLHGFRYVAVLVNCCDIRFGVSERKIYTMYHKLETFNFGAIVKNSIVKYIPTYNPQKPAPCRG